MIATPSEVSSEVPEGHTILSNESARICRQSGDAAKACPLVTTCAPLRKLEARASVLAVSINSIGMASLTPADTPGPSFPARPVSFDVGPSCIDPSVADGTLSLPPPSSSGTGDNLDGVRVDELDPISLQMPESSMRSIMVARRRQTDSSAARTSCARVVDRLRPRMHALASSL